MRVLLDTQRRGMIGALEYLNQLFARQRGAIESQDSGAVTECCAEIAEAAARVAEYRGVIDAWVRDVGAGSDGALSDGALSERCDVLIAQARARARENSVLLAGRVEAVGEQLRNGRNGRGVPAGAGRGCAAAGARYIDSRV